MTRVLHPQDEDADVLVFCEPSDLFLEEVRRPEEEFPFDVDFVDFGVGALRRVVQLGKVSALVDRILDEHRGARLGQEKGERDADAHVDGRVQLEEKA